MNTSPASQRSLPDGSFRSKAVLIVEDEFLIRWSLRARLTAVGYAVLEAADLAGARAIYQRALDLVFLDVRLPDGDGIEFLAEFRMTRPNVPVIVMTAHGTSAMEALAAEAGAFAFVHKPFDLDEVVRLTQRAAGPGS